MRVITINVNGLRDHLKRTAFLFWLSTLSPSPDIVGVQETHCISQEELNSWFDNSPYKALGDFKTQFSWGTLIQCLHQLLIVDLLTPCSPFIMIVLQFFLLYTKKIV